VSRRDVAYFLLGLVLLTLATVFVAASAAGMMNVGQLMGSSPSGITPPSGSSLIITESGSDITTEDGTALRTE
jgi:hypothetical protein